MLPLLPMPHQRGEILRVNLALAIFLVNPAVVDPATSASQESSANQENNADPDVKL